MPKEKYKDDFRCPGYDDLSSSAAGSALPGPHHHGQLGGLVDIWGHLRFVKVIIRNNAFTLGFTVKVTSQDASSHFKFLFFLIRNKVKPLYRRYLQNNVSISCIFWVILHYRSELLGPHKPRLVNVQQGNLSVNNQRWAALFFGGVRFR